MDCPISTFISCSRVYRWRIRYVLVSLFDQRNLTMQETKAAQLCALSLPTDDNRPRFSSGRVAVTVGSLLDDEHWHSVHIERFNRQVNLTVDAHTQHFQTGGEGHSLEVDYEVSPRDGRLT